MIVRYRTRSDANDGRVRATNPHTTPVAKAKGVLSEIRKDIPIPIVVKTTEVRIIVRVDGKATRRMKL